MANIFTFPFHPSTFELRKQPINLKLEDTWLFQREFKRQINSSDIVLLFDITISDSQWWHLKSLQFRGKFQPKHSSSLDLKRVIKSTLGILKSPSHIIKQAIWAHDGWSCGYYHWFADVLPKLLHWKNLNMPLYPLLLPKYFYSSEFVRSSLQILGFPVIFFENESSIFVKKLWSIHNFGTSGNYDSTLLRQVSSTFRDYFSTSSGLDKIWISRRDAPKRFVSNEIELTHLFEKENISMIQTGSKTLQEQVELFSNSTLLMSIHGTGLANMLWMPSGSAVLEIRRTGDSTNNCFYSMAQALGHHYFYLLAEDITGRENSHTAVYSLQPSDMMDAINCIKQFVG